MFKKQVIECSAKKKLYKDNVKNIFNSESKSKKFFTINILALIYFAIIFILVCGVLFLIPKKYNPYSTLNQMQLLEESHNYYINRALDKEKITKWIELFYGCTYAQNSTFRFHKYDCSSAVQMYLNSFGAKIATENVKLMKQRIIRLNGSGTLQLRSNYSKVCVGDIVIFQPFGNNYHMGIVGYKSNGYIAVLDVGAKISTMGINYYIFSDSKIDIIAEVSFSLWIGDTLSDIK